MFEKFLKLFFPTFVAPPKEPVTNLAGCGGIISKRLPLMRLGLGAKLLLKRHLKEKAAPKKRGRPPKAKK